MTAPLRVWFNQTYNTNYWLMQMIRNNPDGVPVHIITSCLNPLSTAAQAGDEVWIEPDLSGREYAQWAAGFARDHGVDVFLPMKNIGDIAEHRDLFGDLPIAHSTAEAIRVFGHKGDAYAAVQHHGVAVPPYRIASTAKGILDAYGDLREVTGGDTLILKPATDVGGVGYRRILHTSPGGLHGLQGSVTPDITLESLETILERAEAEGLAIPEYLLMPYLDEPEVSVDTLTGPDGSIIGAVPRAKYGKYRIIPAAEGIFADILQMTGSISAGFGIRYLTNAQFRVYRGEAVLLEVNARPSGGLFTTGYAGVNMAWACIRVLLGQDQAPLVPQPNSLYLNMDTAIPHSMTPQPDLLAVL